MVYEVIAEPPLEGATQVTTTFVFEITVVVGAAGVLGLAAARTANSDETVL